MKTLTLLMPIKNNDDGEHDNYDDNNDNNVCDDNNSLFNMTMGLGIIMMMIMIAP